MDERLIDRIYECAFAPDGWPSLLVELAEIAGARAGFLFVSNGRINNFVCSTEIGAAAIAPLVASGWLIATERFRRGLAYPGSGFFRELDVYREDELSSDPFYRDLLYPRGLGWAAATAVPLPTGDSFTINLERERVRGPVELPAIVALDELRPHLARAALMAVRLRLEQAQAAAQTLEAIGLPALVLDDRGKVLAANESIEVLDGYLAWRAFDGVTPRDPESVRLLREAIAAIRADGAPAVRSFPIRGNGDLPVMILHLVPIRLAAQDVFPRGAAALVLTPVTVPEAPPVELVRSLFDLTPAEARVARSVASGATAEAMSTAFGVSLATVRTQVRAVLEKTGCHRQFELVALLSGVGLRQR
jgi:DNA-binding CsgD family transcriptional regulator